MRGLGVRGLRVAARTSTFQCKGKHEDLAVIGRKLNVAALLEDTVRRSGNRVRIAVQLVKVANGFHLWLETYNRTLDDISAVQDDIAQSVVKELRAALLGEAPDSKASGEVRVEVAAATTGRGENADAHPLFLQGRCSGRLGCRRSPGSVDLVPHPGPWQERSTSGVRRKRRSFGLSAASRLPLGRAGERSAIDSWPERRSVHSRLGPPIVLLGLVAGALVLGARPLAVAGEDFGALPDVGGTIVCPDVESLTVLYRSEVVTEPRAVTAITVLYGPTRFLPALARGDCDERLRIETVRLFLNEAPVLPDRPGEAAFAADLGHDLGAATVRAEVGLRGPGGLRVLTYQVETLDASAAREATRTLGERREERLTVQSVPYDSLALPVIARGPHGRPVAGLGRESFRFSVDGRQLDAALVKSFRPPEANRPLRLALLVDVSSHLVDGRTGPSWETRWARFVDTCLLDGIRTFARSEHGGAFPEVEIVLVRYAGTPHWFMAVPFLRSKEVDERTLADLRSFFLSPPDRAWRSYESSMANALKAVEPILHYASGATAIVVVGTGRNTAPTRSFRFFPALVPAVRAAREEEVRKLGRELELGDPAGKHDLSDEIRQHNLRKPPLVYAYIVPDETVRRHPLDAEPAGVLRVEAEEGRAKKLECVLVPWVHRGDPIPSMGNHE